ncbi:filamentous hemagglutinin N-terminal domain-containing protein [Capilliphycus salinus ALCB114379]|uniref:two-partner secretion domain-containing protein n=1 Tax=Capilliphycus salinus TaxID=2768948 RepID=UPI0039A718D0
MNFRLSTFSVVGATTVFCLTPLATVAQIVPDNSLGSENSVVVPNQNIRGISSDGIDGGAVRGGNLFHSFQEFNIREGRGAYFSNPDNIVNILTRVTGGNVSEILGTLGVLGNANLFLINPNGIVFGPNARLDVGGSFFATTADGILFENGFEFAASNPAAPPLLTINIPIGLNLRENPGTIVNQAAPQLVRLDGSSLRNDAGFLIPQGLNVPQNQTLALVGGDVLFNNGFAISPGSRIQLGGLSEPGTVQINPDNSLTFPENILRGNVGLTNQSQINVRADGGGDVNINARNVEISGDSVIRAGIDEGLGSLEAQGGDVNINAQENVLITGAESSIRNSIDIDAIGQPGNINVTAHSLTLNDGAFLGTVLLGQGNAGNINIVTNSLVMSNQAGLGALTFGQGNAGVVSISATDSVELSGSNILSSVEEGAVGNGGTIEINTGNLLISEGSQVITSTSGEGNAGNITVKADNIELTGTSADGELISAFFADVNETGVGHGGNIQIKTGQLRLTDRATIQSSTFGQGNAGVVSISATNSVELSSGNIFSNVEQGARGDGGIVEVNTGNLLLSEGSQVITSTSGEGNAGSIIVKAATVELTGTTPDGEIRSGFSADVNGTGMGHGGNIQIETGQLRLTERARIQSGTFGIGNAGSISIFATDLVELSNSSILGELAENAVGDAGNIEISTSSLNAINGQISLIALGNGNAGNIQIEAQQIYLSDSIVAGETSATGNVGNLTINTGTLVVQDGADIRLAVNEESTGSMGNITVNASEFVEVTGTITGVISRINTRTNGSGNAGSVIINTPRLAVRGAGSIFANSFNTGQAGDVFITTNQLIIRDGGFIQTSVSGKGGSGSLQIKANEVEIAGELNLGEFNSRSGLSVFTTGEGTAGTLNLETGRLTVRDGGEISVRSLNGSSAGSINIQASVVELIGGGVSPSLISVATNNLPDETSANLEFSGTSVGSITLEADQLRILNGALILTFSGDVGSSGSIDIRANTIEISGRGTQRIITSLTGEPSTLGSRIVAQAGNGGNTGNISITAQRLVGQDGAVIRTNSSGTGSSGSITIQAQEVTFDNQVFVSSGTAGASNGGDITIETEQLTMQNNSTIFSGISLPDESETPALEIPPNRRGGTVFIKASESLALDGEGTSIIVGVNEEGAIGNGGNIIIETGRLTLSNQAFLSTSTSGIGNAGSVNVEAENIQLADRSFILANVSETGVGNGGTVSVDAEQLTVRNKSAIFVNSDGVGNPGNLEVNASQVRLEQAGLVADSVTGEGGNIAINSPDISVRRGSSISAAGSESGQTFDGNIDINSNLLVLLENSEIVTSAFDPTGGSNINIRPFGNSELGLLQSQNSIINAAGDLSIDTTLNFDPPESLEVTVVDPAELIAQDPCKQRGTSEFVITGRGGIAPNPVQDSSTIPRLVELQSPLIEPVISQPNNLSQPPQQISQNREKNPIDSRTIVPARGWIRTEEGEVILVGYDPTKTGVIRQQSPINQCNPNPIK